MEYAFVKLPGDSGALVLDPQAVKCSILVGSVLTVRDNRSTSFRLALGLVVLWLMALT